MVSSSSFCAPQLVVGRAQSFALCRIPCHSSFSISLEKGINYYPQSSPLSQMLPKGLLSFKFIFDYLKCCQKACPRLSSTFSLIISFFAFSNFIKVFINLMQLLIHGFGIIHSQIRVPKPHYPLLLPLSSNPLLHSTTSPNATGADGDDPIPFRLHHFAPPKADQSHKLDSASINLLNQQVWLPFRAKKAKSERHQLADDSGIFCPSAQMCLCFLANNKKKMRNAS
jgi:hypothetical protein